MQRACRCHDKATLIQMACIYFCVIFEQITGEGREFETRFPLQAQIS